MVLRDFCRGNGVARRKGTRAERKSKEAEEMGRRKRKRKEESKGWRSSRENRSVDQKHSAPKAPEKQTEVAEHSMTVAAWVVEAVTEPKQEPEPSAPRVQV